MPQKKTSNGPSKTAVGLGVAGLALAGLAGAYFLYGSKDAAKNRTKIKSWMLKTKAEVMDKLERAKDLSEENFGMIIDTAAAKYGKNVQTEDIQKYVKSLKKHWREIKREVNGAPKKKASAKK